MLTRKEQIDSIRKRFAEGAAAAAAAPPPPPATKPMLTRKEQIDSIRKRLAAARGEEQSGEVAESKEVGPRLKP
jgi:hypothetical protein